MGNDNGQVVLADLLLVQGVVSLDEVKDLVDLIEEIGVVLSRESELVQVKFKDFEEVLGNVEIIVENLEEGERPALVVGKQKAQVLLLKLFEIFLHDKGLVLVDEEIESEHLLGDHRDV